jgi:hypothetical protein
MSEFDVALLQRPDGRWEVEVLTAPPDIKPAVVDHGALGQKMRDALEEAEKRNAEAE